MTIQIAELSFSVKRIMDKKANATSSNYILQSFNP